MPTKKNAAKKAPAKKKAPAQKLLPTIPYRPAKAPSKAVGKRVAVDYVPPAKISRMAIRTARALPDESIYADRPGAVQRAINRRERREERRYERQAEGTPAPAAPRKKKAAAKKASSRNAS